MTVYTKYADPWEDDPGSTTPIDAAGMDHIEEGIESGHEELQAHIDDDANPHAVTAAQAGAVAAQAGAANIWVQASEPTALATGDLWVKTS